jgi:rhodanese-related sulfurtransferase
VILQFVKIFPLLLLVLNATALCHAADVQKIPPATAAKLVADGKAVLVDVREPAEWAQTGVAAPAELLPMSDFDGDKKLWRPFLEKNAGKQIIVYCRSGSRSGKVAAKLAVEGKTVANAGAFKDWVAAGLPTRTVKASSAVP